MEPLPDNNFLEKLVNLKVRSFYNFHSFCNFGSSLIFFLLEKNRGFINVFDIYYINISLIDNQKVILFH